MTRIGVWDLAAGTVVRTLVGLCAVLGLVQLAGAQHPFPDVISDRVGASVGEFRVNESGQATYSMPIYVPPGTAGVVPEVALRYDSGGGHGPLGAGWSVSGQSAIVRCRQSREAGDFIQSGQPVDGNPPPINFSPSDRFCLDGQRLVLVSGSYGGNGARYRTEVDQLTDVISRGGNNTAGASYTGPQYFEVRRKDGSTSYYGNTTDSRLERNGCPGAEPACLSRILSWSINRSVDSTGNYIDYSYLKNPEPNGPGELLLLEVRYTGKLVLSGQSGQALSPYARVRFNYSALPSFRWQLGYLAGSRFGSTRRLDSIDVHDAIDTSKPVPLRHYRLIYSLSESNSGQQNLVSIRECRDATLAVCYPPTEFAWSSAAHEFFVTEEPAQSGDFTNAKGARLADIDGDGILDRVWVQDVNIPGCTTSRLLVSFGGFDAQGRLNYSTPSQTAICLPRRLEDLVDAWLLFDYDGDGRDDVMIADAFSSGGSPRWRLYRSQGRPVSGGRVFSQIDSLASDGIVIPVGDSSNHLAQLGDFNGDGLLDVLYFHQNALWVRFREQVAASPNDAGRDRRLRFGPQVQISATFQSGDPCALADGLQNRCEISFYAQPYPRIRVADFNGDGRAGVMLLVGHYRWQPPDCPEPPCVPQGNTDPHVYVSTEEEDEGRSRDWALQNVYWYFFNADGVSAGNLGLRQYASALIGVGQFPSDSRQIRFGDLNGDGLTDIVYQVSGSKRFRAAINTGSVFSSGANPSLLTILLLDGQNTDNDKFVDVVDVNGDGRMEVLIPISGGDNRYRAFHWQPPNSTTSVGSFSAGQPLPGSEVHGGDLLSWDHFFADLDGDGVVDYVRMRKVGGYGVHVRRARNGMRYKPRDVIVGIVNGYGAITAVDYAPLTNSAIYRRDHCQDPGGGSGAPCLHSSWGRRSPVFDVLMPLYVVSRVSSSAPVPGNANALSSIYYRYAGARMQGGGRGFLGFREVVSFDGNHGGVPAAHTVAVTRYRQDFPYVGSPQSTRRYVRAGSYTPSSCLSNPETQTLACFYKVNEGFPDLSTAQLVSLSSNLWACTGHGDGSACEPAYGPNQLCPRNAQSLPDVWDSLRSGSRSLVAGGTQQPVFPYIAATNEASFDLATGNATANVFSAMCYEDFHGNLTFSVVDTYPDSGTQQRVSRVRTEHLYQDDSVNWRLGRLTSSMVTFSRPGVPDITRFTDFSYDMSSLARTGLLLSEQVQKDIPGQDLRARYVLDAFGNRLVSFQCSGDVAEVDCDDANDISKIVHRPVDGSGDPTTRIHRYTRVLYDTRPGAAVRGRYADTQLDPYFNNLSSGNQVVERATRQVLERNEFGDPVLERDANSVHRGAVYGTLGRPFHGWTQTGTSTGVYASSTSRYRYCQNSPVSLLHIPSADRVACPNGASFRQEVVSSGGPATWTYYDVLGREVLRAEQSRNIGVSGMDTSGICLMYDALSRPIQVTEPFFFAGSNGPNFSGAGANLCATTSYRTTTTYDVLGRVIRVQGPDGALTTTSYHYRTTSTTNAKSKTWTETRNALGEVIEARDPGGSDSVADDLIVRNEYDAAGNLRFVRRNAGRGDIVNENRFDALGRKTWQSDPDKGIWTYAYNAAGELIRQTDAKGQISKIYLDALGRSWKRTVNLGTVVKIQDTWSHDRFAAGELGIGQVHAESRQQDDEATFSRSYGFDGIGRVVARHTSMDGLFFTESTVYDNLGRVRDQTDAAGGTLTTNYGPRGHVVSLDDSQAGRIYEVLLADQRGQIVQERRGNTSTLTTFRTHDPATGRLLRICTGSSLSSCSTQDLSHDYDVLGNLEARERNAYYAPSEAVREEFRYDNLSRLTRSELTRFAGQVQANPIQTMALTYDALGNICSKATNNAFGNESTSYSYQGRSGCGLAGLPGSGTTSTVRPHAVTGAFGATYVHDSNGNQTIRTVTGNVGQTRTIDVNAMDQVRRIRIGSPSAPTQEVLYAYAPDGSRYRRRDIAGGGQMAIRFVGSVERTTLSNSPDVEWRRDLAGIAVVVQIGSNPTLTWYLLKDHLGSIDLKVQLGSSPVRASYDAHGQVRSDFSWQSWGLLYQEFPYATLKGFTGHEHVHPVGLIHMNGRMYDPHLGRFVQADPFVDAGTQGLNRYTYVLNNPLTLVDPSGYLSWGRVLRTVAAIVITYYTGGTASGLLATGKVAGGLAVAAAGGYAAGYVQTGSGQGGLYGAYSAMLFAGIGAAFQPNNASWAYSGARMTAAGTAAKTLAHGMAGGTMSYLQGGKFGHGFASAGVTQLSSGWIDTIDAGNPGISSHRIVVAAAVGGSVSAATGGKFANGAVTGATSEIMRSSRNNDEVASTCALGECPGEQLIAGPLEYLTPTRVYFHAGPGITYVDGYSWLSEWSGAAAGGRAAQYWADLHVQTGNPIYAIPGMLASLWTPETALQTTLVLGTAGGGSIGFRLGREITFGRNFRVAPFGNRTGHRYGEFPHYHRRGVDSATGQTRPGQGIGRHRPWETRSTDRSWRDRF